MKRREEGREEGKKGREFPIGGGGRKDKGHRRKHKRRENVANDNGRERRTGRDVCLHIDRTRPVPSRVRVSEAVLALRCPLCLIVLAPNIIFRARDGNDAIV